MPRAISPRPSAAHTVGAQVANAAAVMESRRSRPSMPASRARVVAASMACTGESTRSPLRMTVMGRSSIRWGVLQADAASAVMKSVGASCGKRELDMVNSLRGWSEPEAGALDVLLDLVLAHPDLRVRLEIDQRSVHLVENDPLASLDVLDRLEVASEHVTRADLLSLPGPGVGPCILLLVLTLTTQLTA